MNFFRFFFDKFNVFVGFYDLIRCGKCFSVLAGGKSFMAGRPLFCAPAILCVVKSARDCVSRRTVCPWETFMGNNVNIWGLDGMKMPTVAKQQR